MASIYKKGNSPHWYACIWDSTKRGWKNQCTPCRLDDPAGKRAALMWASSRERVALAERPLVRAEAWSTWVIPWMNQTYGYNSKTLSRYAGAWACLNEFLNEHEILTPRHLKRTHGFDYLSWRTAQKRRRGSRINHNTALTELKVLSRVMQEALLRGWCDGNPLYRLGVRRQNIRHTPRMQENEIAIAREALPKYPAWMAVCFELALHHGCRLSETKVPMERVHLDSRTSVSENWDRITFECKGRHGVKQISTVPLNPALRPLMQRLKKAGARYTCELPEMAAKEWWKFRRDTGLQHLRFHSTRSTVASLLAESGVNQQTAMSILVHASETVHLAYQHLNAKPVGDAVAKISYGPDAGPNRLETLGGPNAIAGSAPGSNGGPRKGPRGRRG